MADQGCRVPDDFTIDQIPPGYLWLRARSIDISDELLDAVNAGTATPTRMEEVTTLMRMALNHLATTPPAGVQDWMTLRRAMC